MTTQAIRNNSQIRLLIPASWIEELDSLATIRQSSRLSLIRAYLRENLDRELLRLQESYVRRERIKNARKVAANIAEEIDLDTDF